MAAQDYEQLTNGNPDGSQFGSAATEKCGFWGATPVVQPTVVTAITADSTTTASNASLGALITKLTTIGILAAS